MYITYILHVYICMQHICIICIYLYVYLIYSVFIYIYIHKSRKITQFPQFYVTLYIYVVFTAERFEHTSTGFCSDA